MIKQAKKWLGYKESNGTHKIILFRVIIIKHI